MQRPKEVDGELAPLPGRHYLRLGVARRELLAQPVGRDSLSILPNHASCDGSPSETRTSTCSSSISTMSFSFVVSRAFRVLLWENSKGAIRP
jgi:hypothetical protein